MQEIPSTRRNDPCPCGSGRRFKDCHGRLDAGPAAETPAAMSDRGYALCQKGDFAAGVPLLERAASIEPGDAHFQNRVGLMRYVLGDLAGAVAPLERAIALSPGMPDPHSNLALVLRDSGDPERALGEARRALELNPQLAPARLNLALILLVLGRFAEAWPALSWRPDPRANLRDIGVPNALPHAATLAPATAGPLTLHGEQGLGDTLFFLRFVQLFGKSPPALRFWGDARLGPILVRSGAVAEAFDARSTPPDLDPVRLVWVGDLPSLTRARDRVPAPLPLVADATRRSRMVERLAQAGPPPYIALTWRSGLARRGKTVLAKEIAPALLGETLAGVRATWISVQREPAEGETAALSRSLGAPVADFSSCNADLEDMLALMDVIDDYVGVSNTNTHLRAGLGRGGSVLVPWPAEWRWMREGARSPWFPQFAVYRAGPQDDWSDARSKLRTDLG